MGAEHTRAGYPARVDEALRGAEREARGSDDAQQQQRLLTGRLRAGQLSSERLGLAAFFGHAGAREVLGLGRADGGARLDPQAWIEAARPAAQPGLVVTCLGAGDFALARWKAWFPQDQRAPRAWAAVEAWLSCPCEPHLEDARLASAEADLTQRSIERAGFERARADARESLHGLPFERVQLLARLGHQGAMDLSFRRFQAPSDLLGLEDWLRELFSLCEQVDPALWRAAADAAAPPRREDSRTSEQRWPEPEPARAWVLAAARERHGPDQRLGEVPLRIARALRPLVLGERRGGAPPLGEDDWQDGVLMGSPARFVSACVSEAGASLILGAGLPLGALLADLARQGRLERAWESARARVIGWALA